MPTVDFDFPEADELREQSPREVVETVRDVTNLDGDDLRQVKDSGVRERYLEDASDMKERDDEPLAGGPIEDAITLHEVPLDEADERHKKEGIELINFGKRATAQFDKSEGDDLAPDRDANVSSAYAALNNWGFDPVKDDYLK
jgi:hypothetical protein